MSVTEPAELDGAAPADDAGARPSADDGWLKDKRGRDYIRRQSGQGILYRKGEESPMEALARDLANKDEKPKRKSKTPHKPPPPSQVDLRELESILSEAFQSPAMMCATFGDQWAANHFTSQGPYLARNLCVAAQHNPWLRRKLESAATGGDAAMKLVTMLGVGGALFAYAIPPIVYWFNLPVPDDARTMFGIPDRKADHAPTPQHHQEAHQPAAHAA